MCCPAPCAPLHVGVDLQCGTNTATLYWDKTDGVDLYVATASSSLGVTLQCNSTNSTCQFSNLNCGEMYKFSVAAYSNKCPSENSSAVNMQTGMGHFGLLRISCHLCKDIYDQASTLLTKLSLIYLSLICRV